MDAEDDLRVGILTGAGGTFCSGMDLKGFLRGESPSVEGRGFGGVVQAPPAKPLIAAVEGYAARRGPDEAFRFVAELELDLGRPVHLPVLAALSDELIEAGRGAQALEVGLVWPWHVLKYMGVLA